MKIITNEEFERICQNEDAIVLKHLKDGRPKILETKQGEIVKIFYARNKWFSAWKNRKTVSKFCKNAAMLAEKGIVAPTIKEILYCPAFGTYLVCYDKLPGINLRIMTRQGYSHVLADVAKFVAMLHQNGIFFRSLHLENLLAQENGHFALVDIVDVRFKRYPLNLFLRYRNIKHIFSMQQDKLTWKNFGHNAYLNLYYQATTISRLSKKLMTLMLKYKFA